jgi:hypothetical protein
MVMDMDTPEDYAALLRHLGYPTYPDEYTCYKLLEKFETPENTIRHSRQVGSTALRIADLLTAQGVTVNKPLLYSACVLHDIARAEPEHAAAGALRLLTEGYPDTAALVRFHMDLPEGLALDSPPPESWELLILYLADKLCRDGPAVPPDKTLALLEQRFSGNPEALAGARQRMAAAQAILELLDRKHRITLGDILGA